MLGEKDSDSGQQFVMESLKYTFPKKISATDNAKIALRKALTSDQSVQNEVMAKEFKRCWTAAVVTLFLRAKLYFENEESNKENENGEEDEEKAGEEKEDDGDEIGVAKEGVNIPDLNAMIFKNGKNATIKGPEWKDISSWIDSSGMSLQSIFQMAPQSFEADGGGVPNWKFQKFLYDNGINRLNEMLEEDEDVRKIKKEIAEKASTKERDQAYEAFVRNKNRLRLRVPEEPEHKLGGIRKPPRLDFSMGKGVFRPKKQGIPSNTLELMRGSGLKYIHTLGKMNEQGMEGDLEKCQRALLQQGHVFKENFHPDSDSDEDNEQKYKREVKSNKAFNLKKQADKNRKIGCKKSFQLWRTKKEVCEKAVKTLDAVDKPELVAEYESEDAAKEHWIEVGKALKAIDRNLFSSWKEWTSGFQSNYKCTVLWNYFEPRCCDVHSASYSGVRDTLLKLLRPGVNYKKVFERAALKKWIKAEKQAEEEDKEVHEIITDSFGIRLPKLKESELTGDDKEAILEKLKKPRREVVMSKKENKEILSKLQYSTKNIQEIFMERVELDKKDMKAVLKDIGIKVENEQLRRIIDAFDENKDGTVSKNEFLEFISPETSGGESRPVIRGDTSAVLERKCVFESTCHKTGMPNAFVVTAVVGKPKKSIREDPMVTVTKMNNGEYRIKTELPELAKHKKILSQFADFGIDVDEEMEEPPSFCEIAKWDRIDLYSDGTSGHDDGEDYSDDEEDGYSDDDVDDTTKQSIRVRRQKKALDELMDKSKENRAALSLKKMMDKGKPPPAPELWCSHEEQDLETDKLRLCWRALPGSFVAFFTLEISGALGSKAQQNNEFREIFRDPPDATYEADFGYWVEDLEPNTTYTFRLRAFNGFGAGPYVRGEFTTQPSPPAQPVLISTSTNSLTLRWRFSEKNAAHFNSLRQIVEITGEGNVQNGVTRLEFMLALDSKSADLIGFLKSTVIDSLGGISIYDAIESSDDDYLTISEIDRYEQLLSSNEVDDDKHSTGLSLTRTRYVVEQCVNQQEDLWNAVWRGSAGEAMVKSLETGHSYRYRVYAVNVDGVAGEPSESTVANTLLETPAPARTVRGAGSIGSSFVKISWDGFSAMNKLRNSGTANKNGHEKLFAEWTKSEAIESDGGVSLDRVFSAYDTQRSDRIDGSDLLRLLQDLGVNCNEDRLREAWEHLDNGDGSVEFDAFRNWWKNDSISYVIKRNDGAISYRGSRTSIEIDGLQPNTEYTFRVRNTSSNSHSKFSAPLSMYTLPSPPKSPTLIAVTESSALMKLYFGKGGGSKFVLQRKLIKTLSMARKAETAARKHISEGWTYVYEGKNPLVKINGLLPNCIYQFRCKGINEAKMAGGFSEMVMVHTNEHKVVHKAASAPETFTIECTGDVVTGDLILFTERLFVTGNGKLVGGGMAGNGLTMSKGRDGVMTPRLNMSDNGSVTSNASGSSRRGTRDEKKVEFAGERTVAARVLSKRVGGTTQNTTKVNKKISIRMECLWSSVSDKNQRGFLIKEGMLIEREEDQIFNFETFRSEWIDESLRVCSKDEV